MGFSAENYIIWGVGLFQCKWGDPIFLGKYPTDMMAVILEIFFNCDSIGSVGQQRPAALSQSVV